MNSVQSFYENPSISKSLLRKRQEQGLRTFSWAKAKNT